MSGPSDAFVTKIVNRTVEWSTYLGGRGDDTGTALAFDRSGNLVVAGYTASSDFPGAVGEPWHGGEDGFITQFDPNGSIVQTTYLGTSGDDRAIALAVDGQGMAHVVGWSREQGEQPLLASIRLRASPSFAVNGDGTR